MNVELWPILGPRDYKGEGGQPRSHSDYGAFTVPCGGFELGWKDGRTRIMPWG